MVKNVNNTPIRLKKGDSTTLSASFIGKYKWNYKGATTRSIVVSPLVGKSTFVVRDEIPVLRTNSTYWFKIMKQFSKYPDFKSGLRATFIKKNVPT